MTIAFGHVSQNQTADEWWTYFLALEKLAESSVAIGCVYIITAPFANGYDSPAFDCLRLGIILSQSFAYQMSYARGDAWPTRYLVVRSPTSTHTAADITKYYLFLGSLAHSTYSLYIAIINDLQVTWTECTSIQENGRAVRSCLSQSSALPSR